jgi:hypothetical protein
MSTNGCGYRLIGGKMIKFEHNSLVLDSAQTKEDQKAINDFLEYKLEQLKLQLKDDTIG